MQVAEERNSKISNNVEVCEAGNGHLKERRCANKYVEFLYCFTSNI